MRERYAVVEPSLWFQLVFVSPLKLSHSKLYVVYISYARSRLKADLVRKKFSLCGAVAQQWVNEGSIPMSDLSSLHVPYDLQDCFYLFSLEGLYFEN